MNQTIDLMDARCSTRAYAETPITDEEKRLVLHAAMRAPHGRQPDAVLHRRDRRSGAQGPARRHLRPSPFICAAPWVLLFVADHQRWMDLFGAAGVDRIGPGGRPAGVTPGVGDLMLACCAPSSRPERGDRG